MNDDLKNVLFPGEEVLWRGKPKKLCYVLSKMGSFWLFALLWLVFDGLFIGVMISTGTAKEMWLFLVCFFALHLLPVWKCVGGIISSILEHKNIEYAITNRRIIARTGIVGIDFDSIDYVGLSNIRVNVSFIERLFHVGSVWISASSGAHLVLFSVEEPYDIYRRANQVLMDIKSDVYYPNAYRPEDNPGYKTKYTNK